VPVVAIVAHRADSGGARPLGSYYSASGGWCKWGDHGIRFVPVEELVAVQEKAG